MKNGLFPAWRNWVQADYYYSTTTVNDFNDRLLITSMEFHTLLPVLRGWRPKILHFHLNLFSSVFFPPQKLWSEVRSSFLLPSIILCFNCRGLGCFVFSCCCSQAELRPSWLASVPPQNAPGRTCRWPVLFVLSKSWQQSLENCNFQGQWGIRGCHEEKPPRLLRSRIGSDTTRKWECRALVTPRGLRGSKGKRNWAGKPWDLCVHVPANPTNLLQCFWIDLYNAPLPNSEVLSWKHGTAECRWKMGWRKSGIFHHCSGINPINDSTNCSLTSGVTLGKQLKALNKCSRY